MSVTRAPELYLALPSHRITMGCTLSTTAIIPSICCTKGGSPSLLQGLKFRGGEQGMLVARISRARASRRFGVADGLHAVVVVSEVSDQEPGFERLVQWLLANLCNVQTDQPVTRLGKARRDAVVIGENEVDVKAVVPLLCLRRGPGLHFAPGLRHPFFNE